MVCIAMDATVVVQEWTSPHALQGRGGGAGVDEQGSVLGALEPRCARRDRGCSGGGGASYMVPGLPCARTVGPAAVGSRADVR